MNRNPGERTGRNLGAPVALILGFPVVSVGWGILKVLFGPGRWRPKLIALSIFGNMLFVFVVILGYYVSEAYPPSPEEEAALVGPDFVPCVNAPLDFVEARRESELARALPNVIYAAFDGNIRATFEFVDGTMKTLKEVGLSDKYGRPWMTVNLDNEKLVYTRYRDEEGAVAGDVTLVDEDGDGIPDVMVNWDSQTRFKREEELKWRRTHPE